MSYVNVSPDLWRTPEFTAFLRLSGFPLAEAVGTIVLFLQNTRSFRCAEFGDTTLMDCLPINAHTDRATTLGHLKAAGYVRQDVAGALSVTANAGWLASARRHHMAGKKGGRPKKDVCKPTRPAPVATVPPEAIKRKPTPEMTEANRQAWSAYASLYRIRWGVEPKRNRKTNALIAQFVQRVGADDAPDVLKFFVHHNGNHYQMRQHDLTLAVRDAEGLWTQYQRGQAMTQAEVSQTEGKDRLKNQMARLSASIRADPTRLHKTPE